MKPFEELKMDKIHIRDLSLRCIIGIYPEERRELQDVLINITMECDLSGASKTDAIDDTVDYKSINKEIIRLVEASEYNLIETMAEKIAEICLSRDGVQRAIVTVDKPGALRFARSVAVEFDRSNPNS